MVKNILAKQYRTYIHVFLNMFLKVQKNVVNKDLYIEHLINMVLKILKFLL